MKRTFVIGDIHGADKALLQVLDRSSFDYENDTLISLGDICDGWSGVKETIDILMKVKNLILIKGNHDAWYLQFLDQNKLIMESNARSEKSLTLDVVNKYDDGYSSWLSHGGQATIESLGLVETIYSEFLRKGKLIHIDKDNNLFCHAGGWMCDDVEDLDYVYDYFPFTRQSLEYKFIWDRSDIRNQISYPKKISRYNNIYVGHTPVISIMGYQSHRAPLVLENVIMMDTGAAFTGVVSMRDINTGENFTSDVVMELYPNETGRNK